MNDMISVEEFAKIKGAGVILLDVREDYELKTSRLDPCVHIPLDDLPDNIDKLDKEKSYVVICRTGNRSNTAAKFLRAQGFKDVRNLVGGINDWVEKIDPTMKKY